jgi:hypothetical protein
LAVSRELLAETRSAREAASPFTISVEIVQSAPGSAVLEFRNSEPTTVVRLMRVEIRQSPGDQLLFEQDLAEGTLGGPRDDQWQVPFAFEDAKVGDTFYVKARGNALGGPVMDRPFAFRVGSDRRLIDMTVSQHAPARIL